MKENLTDKSLTEKEASPSFEGFRHPFILACLIYLGPICFLVLLIFLQKIVCFPDLVDSLLTVNVMSFILNIHALLQIRHQSLKSYLHLKLPLVFPLLFFLFFYFKTDLLYDGIPLLFAILTRVLLSCLLGVLFAMLAGKYCLGGKNTRFKFGIFKKDRFSPGFKWYFFPFLIAMIVSGKELFVFGGLAILRCAVLFPVGLLGWIELFVRNLKLLNILTITVCWAIYIVLISLGAVFCSRKIWFAFIVLLLVNIMGCRIMLFNFKLNF